MSSIKKKPAQKSRLKAFKRILLSVAVFCTLLLLTFPWWSRLAAKPLLEHFAKAEIEAIEQPSWRRWELRGASLEQAAFDLTVKSAEIPSPSGWLVDKLFARSEKGPLRVSDWQLVLKESQAQPEKKKDAAGIPAIFEQANDAIKLARSNVGEIELLDGSISLGDKPLLEIERIASNLESATAKLELTGPAIPVDLMLDFSDRDRWQVRAEAPSIKTAVDLDIVSNASSLLASASIVSSGNTITAQADWLDQQQGLLPRTANLKTERFVFDQRYEFWNQETPLPLTAEARWEEGAYSYTVHSLDAGESSAEPQVELSGQGDLQSVTVESASVELPWLLVENDAPLTLDFTLENPLQNAEIKIRSDLARLPWGEADGILRATIRTESAVDDAPVIAAQIDGNGISLFETRIELLTGSLSVLGKRVTLQKLEVRSEAGSELVASGEVDLEAGSLSDVFVQGHFLNESARLNELLPITGWSSATLAANASGPFANPVINSNVAIADLKLPQLQTVSVTLETEGSLDSMLASLVATAPDENRLAVDATISRSAENLRTNISIFSIQRDGTPLLALNQPATLQMQSSTGALALSNFILQGNSNSRIGVTDFKLQDDLLALDLYASEITPDVIAAWLTPDMPPIRLIDLAAKVALTPSGSQISTSGEAMWQLDDGNMIEASWRASQSPDDNGSLLLDHLEVGSGGKHIVRANGTLPVSFSWAQRAFATSLRLEAPLALSLKSEPHPDFWKSLESMIPFALSQPTIDAQFTGTLDEPVGRLDLRLDTLTWKVPGDGERKVQLANLNASLRADSNTLEIVSFSSQLGKNTMQATASLPLGESGLNRIVKTRQWPAIEIASGQATIEITDLEAVSPWLPEFVRKQGGGRVEVTVENSELNAVVDIQNLATRPLPPLGALSKVSGRLSFQDGVLRTRRLSGLAEQSAFEISGSVDLSNARNPRYDLAFTSDQFPIIRDAGLLLTGDIDLQLVSETPADPVLKGAIQLTKGLVLVEPELLAGSTKTSRQRPPYFAVEARPFHDWLLDVEIRGDEFLRVSNAFFEGTLSADFALEGTLGDPLLIGKATANQGRIFFPASSLALVNGEARITRDRPTEIQVEANAEGRLYAYDINLSASGMLENLDVSITTNPALTQVEALLLVTTGTVPDSQGSMAEQSATSLGLFIGKGLFRKLTNRNKGDAASRLSIEVGNDISRQGKKTIDATYRLTETLDIEAEYDKRDEYNANLKWTFFQE